MTSGTPDNGPERGEFEAPPAGAVRREDAEEFEEASVEFHPPGDAETEAEEAAVAPTAEGLEGVPSGIIEAKGELEQRLRETAEEASGARSAESFEDAGNIQGVAIGLNEPEGLGQFPPEGEPGTPALTVYLADPAPADQLKSVIVEAMGVRAAASDDVPINPVVTGLIDAQPHRFRIRPAPGGVSVAHRRVTAGTIGCLSTGRTAPRSSRLLILSNNHVLANSNSATYGDCICQPGPYDGGTCPADQVAILERFVPITFGGGVNYVDCATGWAWPDRVRRELVYLSGGTRRFFRISGAPVAPSLGMPVGKSGRTTQLTSGRVTAIGASISVNYGSGRVAFFRDQIAVRATSGNFSAGGDSGSSVWTWNATRNPVGLLFAGGGGTTFANRMTRVLAALDIRLYT
jgi:hypothetical protein